jgi:hypothetical protein
MRRQFVFWIVLFILTLGLILVTPLLVNSREILIAQGMMHDGMMGGGGDMNIIHQLFTNRGQIHRTVREIPHGIQAVTESDNPNVTALIQSHVPKMYQRIDNGQTFPMIRMVATLPTMFSNANRYQRQYELTSKGIIVTETSGDRDMVDVIREHAREVTGFVEKGMPAMMENMMK